MAEISVVGLGALGGAIAARLLESGHTVKGFNRTRSKAADLEEKGLIVAETITEACDTEFLITVLWDDQAIENLLVAEAKIFEAGSALCHLCVTTISTDLARKLGDGHTKAGQKFLSVPVFGRSEEALNGKLTVLTGGPQETIDHARAVLESLGNIVVAGESPRAANAMKMAGNFLMAASLESLRESIALVTAENGDPAKFVEVITETLYPLSFYKRFGDALAGRDPATPLPNPFVNSASLTSAGGKSLGLDLPVARVISERGD